MQWQPLDFLSKKIDISKKDLDSQKTPDFKWV